MLNPSRRRAIWPLGALFVLLASCSHEPAEQPAEQAARLVLSTRSVFEVSKADAAARCLTRASSALRAATKQQLSSDTLVARQLNEEVLSYQSGDFNTTCALASGWLTLLDTKNFAQHREGAKEPSRESVEASARAVVRALEVDGVIESAQLDWENVRFSTTTAGGGEGKGFPGLGPFYVQTKMTLPRKIEGVPVVGNGLKITVDAELRVVAIQLFWRALEKKAADSPIAKTMDSAFSELAQRGAVQASHVQQKALAYVDSGIRSSQAYFEPWYVFETKESPADKRHLHLVEAIAAVRSPEVRSSIEGVLESDRGGLR